MAIFYVDTSALAKLYMSETGSRWLRGVLDPASGASTYIVRITAVELISAITRRERSGSLLASDAATTRAAIRTDVSGQFQIVEITPGLVAEAMALAERHALRGYDAVQLAAALELNVLLQSRGVPSLTLVSADTELNTAALAEGLPVEDPNQHP